MDWMPSELAVSTFVDPAWARGVGNLRGHGFVVNVRIVGDRRLGLGLVWRLTINLTCNAWRWRLRSLQALAEPGAERRSGLILLGRRRARVPPLAASGSPAGAGSDACSADCKGDGNRSVAAAAVGAAADLTESVPPNSPEAVVEVGAGDDWARRVAAAWSGAGNGVAIGAALGNSASSEVDATLSGVRGLSWAGAGASVLLGRGGGALSSAL